MKNPTRQPVHHLRDDHVAALVRSARISLSCRSGKPPTMLAIERFLDALPRKAERITLDQARQLVHLTHLSYSIPTVEDEDGNLWYDRRFLMVRNDAVCVVCNALKLPVYQWDSILFPGVEDDWRYHPEETLLKGW